MNELLAIIAIVILCCLMFFAWLLSMAICPDAMVNLLSGRKERYCPSNDSNELIAKCEEANISHEFLKNVVSAEKIEKIPPLPTRRSSDKKLSVVPEADEQSTIQSTIHSIRPTILRRQPFNPGELEEESEGPSETV
ncbi:unnamed protein product [Caenorhabditis bovis]|uniref:Uncharacterized protein n=1 Tax=Caenorhabditis bovis TaxID=2654633 RepID=A0A8S1EA30_9PELO|nr:unnamed protein product [Caenorhabditis bovis]